MDQQDFLKEQSMRIEFLECELDTVRQQKIELEKQLERTAMRRRELENLLSLHEKTGLPTHFCLKTEMQEILEQISRQGLDVNLSVMILQLDSTVSTLQKTTKASISEWVVYQLGNRFLESLGDKDRVFHTRDNEFVFLLFDHQENELDKKVDLIFQSLREPFVFSNIKVNLDGRAGISFFPEHGISRSNLLRHADIALGVAADKRLSTVVFSEELMRHVIDKVDLQNSIIRAIEAPAMQNIDRQFFLHFQPKVFLKGDIASLEVTGMEAEVLMRWDHPEKGSIPPDRFIVLAEETGLIMPMGKWVIYNAIKQQKLWIDKHGFSMPLAVNLSARQVSNDDVIDIVRSMVDKGDLDPAMLVLELTETSLFEDPQQARRFMDIMSEIGVRISIDDFGTGYSSFSYLRRFPLHEIKIDRTFTSRILTSQADEAIVRSIVHLAQQLNWNIVAEGVENVDELRLLRSIGVNCFQGYLFCRPQAQEKFREYAQAVLKGNLLYSTQE